MTDPNLTDDEIDAFVLAPETIPDRETCRIVMDVLDNEIAGIQTQLDVKAVELGVRQPSEQERDWIHRAAYAKAMRANERQKVWRREKELRNVRRVEHIEGKLDKQAVHIAKQERFRTEAEAKKLATQERVLELQVRAREAKLRPTFQHHFHQIARETLSAEQYEAIADQARSRSEPSEVAA